MKLGKMEILMCKSDEGGGGWCHVNHVTKFLRVFIKFLLFKNAEEPNMILVSIVSGFSKDQNLPLT